LCAVCVPPPLEQLIACALLPQLDSLLRRRAAELRSQRDHLAELLRDDQTWSFTVPHGGLWLWLRLASTSGDDLAAQAAAAGSPCCPARDSPRTGHTATGCGSPTRRRFPSSTGRLPCCARHSDPRPRAARQLPQRFPGSVRPQPPTPAKGGAGCGP